MRSVEITKEPVELYKVLKFENLATSGGEAKLVIAHGQVLVNGEVELRKRKKIYAGDIIQCGNDVIRIINSTANLTTQSETDTSEPLLEHKVINND